MAEMMTFTMRGSVGITPEQMSDIMSDLNAGSDRAVGIVGGSLVETCLTETLKAHWHRDEKITEELFNITGALGAFKTKIHLGYLTGIYGKKGLKELLIIKDIRNKFAHSLEVRDFKTPQIASWAKNLSFGERYTQDHDKAPSRDPGFDYKNRPVGEWPMWLYVIKRDEMLKNPRERFLISVQALIWGLSVPSHPAMPRPHF